MSIVISGRLSNKHLVTLTHEPSKALIETAPPKDNGGDGSKFSPTDLCAASLGTCAATVMSLFAVRNHLKVDSIEFSVTKEMQSSPRRISRLHLSMNIKTSCSDKEFEDLVNAGKSCPVRLSLHPEILISETYSRV